jgi:hypothetical protein
LKSLAPERHVGFPIFKDPSGSYVDRKQFVMLGEPTFAGDAFSPGVNVMSNHSEENYRPADSSGLYSIANRKLVV